MNGLIRQYLPKGIDLNQADQHYLNQVAMSLNTRPRKALDWLTPLEKFAQLVDYHKTFKLSHLMFEFAQPLKFSLLTQSIYQLKIRCIFSIGLTSGCKLNFS